MGLRQVGDLLGLPRAGLARRFGETLLAEIDAAFGRRPDPREPIVPPRLFESRLELFARADSTEQVLHGASILLARLVAWLAAQHAFVRRFRLLMHHETRWQQGDRTPQATALEIALAEPSRDSAHLLVLLRERLAQVQLPAPTLEIALQAEDIVKRAAPNSELFPTRQSENEGLTRLIERLQARLGAGSGAAPRPASRTIGPSGRAEGSAPTRAGGRHARRRAAAGAHASPTRAPPREASSAATASCASRPVWLQPVAEPLAERRSRPLLDGRPLSLLSGPERIEAGWWDAELAERDYFIAEAADGALVWIYRARLPLSAVRRERERLVPARPLRLGTKKRSRSFVPSAALFADQREAAAAQRIAQPAVAVDAAEQHVDGVEADAREGDAGGARGRRRRAVEEGLARVVDDGDGGEQPAAPDDRRERADEERLPREAHLHANDVAVRRLVQPVRAHCSVFAAAILSSTPDRYRVAGSFRSGRHGHRRYKVCFGRFASLLEPAIVAIASGR